MLGFKFPSRRLTDVKVACCVALCRVVLAQPFSLRFLVIFVFYSEVSFSFDLSHVHIAGHA